jgi:hypothetical protein
VHGARRKAAAVDELRALTVIRAQWALSAALIERHCDREAA